MTGNISAKGRRGRSLFKFRLIRAIGAWWALVAVLMSLVSMGVGALGLAFLAAGDVYDYQDTAQMSNLPEVDVIACLTGARGRIETAGEIWFKYWENRGDSGHVPVLYLAGMGHHASWSVLARHLKPRVLEALRPEAVLMEIESNNTEENAQEFFRYAKQKGWKRVLLLTSPYHMKRARLIFSKTLARDPQTASLDVQSLTIPAGSFEPREWRSSGLYAIRVTVWEYLKLIHYRFLWNPKSG